MFRLFVQSIVTGKQGSSCEPCRSTFVPEKVNIHSQTKWVKKKDKMLCNCISLVENLDLNKIICIFGNIKHVIVNHSAKN